VGALIYGPKPTLPGDLVLAAPLIMRQSSTDLLDPEPAVRSARPNALAWTDQEAESQPENGDRGSAEWVAAALEAALALRAPGVYASTPLVRQLAIKVSRELGLDAETKMLLDLSVRVRDIGMLALADGVVRATAPLSPADWELVNRHPVIGAQLLAKLSVTAPTAEIVLCHHERWDGDGYPDGRRGDEIPLLSRVIATCDAFVAMATDRPHRRALGAGLALEHVHQARGSQFDPDMVDTLLYVVTGTSARRQPAPAEVAEKAVSRRGQRVQSVRDSWLDLTNVITEFNVIPAFAPAYERIVVALASEGTTAGELVAAIESDTGLTVAVLRRAQAAARRHPSANVPDAVARLSLTELGEAIKVLPRTEFPWRTSQLEVLMHRFLVHAQAVARAADRIARELGHPKRDDILVAALLHDIGKLVLGRARAQYTDLIDPRTASPEKRIREERRAFGTDHASLGGLLLRRWGLPRALATTVTSHHNSEAAEELSTYVRLADMVAHHAQGETVDRRKLLSLCNACGLSTTVLRDVLFDLPHSDGSQRRRADRSPLSARETVVLRVLAQGKTYKGIALELAVATSTVRSHLHNTYRKLGVDDRAQAVLRATEMGWL
jgi:putative nucleotidyltransferase with HDIG domain